MNATLNAQIPGDVDAFLQAEAKRLTCSKSAVARQILMEHMRQRKAEQPAAGPAFPREDFQPKPTPDQKEAA